MSLSLPVSSTNRRAGLAATIALLVIATIIGLSVVQAAQLGATVNISRDAESSLKPKVAQDPGGNVHVVWESGEDRREIRYAKGVWDGSRYNFGQAVSLGGVGSFQYSFPNVVVAPNGTVMVAWSPSFSRLVVRTWNASAAQPGGTNVEIDGGIRVSIAPDSASRFHLAWDRDKAIEYCVWTGSTCEDRLRFPESEPPAVRADIAVDRANNVHVVWDIGQSYRYRARLAGGAWRGVEDMGGGNFPSITADARGQVHIVRSFRADIYYCRRTIDTPCGADKILDSTTDLSPALGVTRTGDVLVAYRDSDFKGLWYATLEDGAWSGSTLVGGANATSQPDVTSRPYSNRISFVWDQGADILHNWVTMTPDDCDFFPAGSLESGELTVQQVGAFRLYLPSVFRGPNC
jgi:hypothetical protein